MAPLRPESTVFDTPDRDITAILRSTRALIAAVEAAEESLAATVRLLQLEIRERLGLVIALLDLEARGLLSDMTIHRPLAALADAGYLEGVACILIALAQHPERFDAVYELAHGATLDIVAGEMPSRPPARRSSPVTSSPRSATRRPSRS